MAVLLLVMPVNSLNLKEHPHRTQTSNNCQIVVKIQEIRQNKRLYWPFPFSVPSFAGEHPQLTSPPEQNTPTKSTPSNNRQTYVKKIRNGGK